MSEILIDVNRCQNRSDAHHYFLLTFGWGTGVRSSSFIHFRFSGSVCHPEIPFDRFSRSFFGEDGELNCFPMEVTSFGFAVIAEARALTTSIKTRIANYQKGPEAFQRLSDSINCLAEHIAEVERILEKFPRVVPADISDVFSKSFSRVRDSLAESNETMERSFSKAFARSSSTALEKLRTKAHRAFRATALSSTMSALESKIEKSSNVLVQLTLTLGNVLKIQEHHDALLPKFENLALVEEVQDVYHPRTNAPALTDTVNLDFDAKDEDWRPATSEATLKAAMRSSDISRSATPAAGVMKPAYGVVGMAGVGKTVALQGLARDKDVRTRFPDGVLFMTLGQDATVQTVLRELAKILAITGATTIVETVQKSTSLSEGVDYAVPWFEGRVFLLLVDDIWPTASCTTGFLTDLRQLLRDSPDSRMAVSTRSTAIAHCAGVIVRFEARDPLGHASQKIFMAHATGGVIRVNSSNSGQELRRSVSNILSLCSGLPIALAVTGCAVAFLTTTLGDFDKACDVYAIRLEKNRRGLGNNVALDGTSLNGSIRLSLEYLEAEFLKWKSAGLQLANCSITDFYISLCVMEYQAWMPVRVLERLWQLDEDTILDVIHLFCGMSLATLHWRPVASNCSLQPGIVLHDLQLDFCQRRAQEMKTSPQWHAHLLNGYIQSSTKPTCAVPTTQITQAIVRFAPRAWWCDSFLEDGYIHFNVARHLVSSGQGIELAALLLDVRWTKLRAKLGGITALKSDFGFVQRCFEEHSPFLEVRQGFEQILKAVQLSWGRMSEQLRTFQFQVCGRLVLLRKSSIFIDAYLTSVETNTPKPYLLPVSQFFPDLNSALQVEIPVRGQCYCVACSPCGRYIAAGATNDVVIVEAGTGDILQRLHGHTNAVSCVAFVDGSKKVVSGSLDSLIILWDWDSSNGGMEILRGHRDEITGLAVSEDGEHIFSSSADGTLRIWNVLSTFQIGEFSQSAAPNCLCVAANGRKISFGFFDGTLKVLDRDAKDILFEDTEAHEDCIDCVSFSPDGRYLTTGSRDETIRVWNVETWTRAYEPLKGHEDWVTSVAFGPDGTKIASCSQDGTVRLWDFRCGACIGISAKTPGWMKSVSFTANGERIVSGSDDGTVRIWDGSLREEAKEPSYSHSDSVYGVSISQDGHRVASASRDRTLRLWDAHTGEQIGVPLEGHIFQVTCVSFSPDGRQLVSGSVDNTIMRWSAETYSQIGNPFEGHSDVVSCVTFSTDGLRVYSGSFDNTIREWNLITHEQAGIALQGHANPVSSVSESSDGYHLVSKDLSRTTIIWNRGTRMIIWKSEQLESEYKNSITDAEAERIISSCGQETPHLWPGSFLPHTGALYCEDPSVYSNVLGGKTLLTNLLSYSWKYDQQRNLFAAGMATGAVAICKLISE